MAYTGQNDAFYANNPRTLAFSIDDEDNPGSKLNMTNKTAKWALSKYRSGASHSTTAILEKSTSDGITVTNATEGELSVALEPADTADLVGDYYYELEIYDLLDRGVVVATGTLTIIRNVNNS